MSKSIFIVIAAAVLLASCFRLGVRGSGVIITEQRQVADFSRVEVSGAYRVAWSGGKTGLSISADDNLLPLIETEVSDGALHIHSKEPMVSTKSISVILSSATLVDVQSSGANSFRVSRISGTDLKVAAAGASDIEIDGTIEKLEVKLTGASKLNASGLQTQSASLSLVGASSADVTVASALKASISGAGSLVYSGNPGMVEQNVTGAGSIRRRP
jgi:hypothetical protein